MAFETTYGKLYVVGRARVNWATVGDAGVMGEVGYVPFGRWQRTSRAAHASEMTTLVLRLFP